MADEKTTFEVELKTSEFKKEARETQQGFDNIGKSATQASANLDVSVRTLQKYAREIQAVGKAHQSGLIDNQKLTKEIGALESAFKKAGGNSQGFAEVLRFAESQAAKTAFSVKAVGEAAAKSSGGFQTLQVAIGTALGNVAANALQKFTSSLSQIPSQIAGALKEAQQIEGLSRSFENLQYSAGQVADVSLAKLRDATRGLVSDMDLMKAANNAVLLGLPTEGFDQMAAAAIKLGQAMGRDANGALSDLILGVGRGSKLILDNLGVIVNAEEAYKKFADSIHTTVDALTDQEKKMAFTKAAYEAIISGAAKTGEAQETAGVAIGRFSAALENQRSTILQTLSGNENLRDSINRLASALSQIDFRPLVDGLAEIIAIGANAAAILTRVGAAVSSVFNDKFELTDQLKNSIGAVDQLATRMEKFNDSIKLAKTAEDFDILQKNLTAIGTQIQTLSDQVPEHIKRGFLDSFEKIRQKASDAKKSIAEIASAPISLDGIKDFASKLDSLISLKAKNVYTDQQYNQGLKEQEAAFKKAGGTSEEFARILKNQLALAQETAGKKAETLNNKLKEQREKLEQVRSANGVIGVTNEVKRLSEAYADGIINLGEYNAEIDKFKAKLSEAGVAATRVDEIISKGKVLGQSDGSSGSDLLKGSSPSGGGSLLSSILGQFGFESSGGLQRTDVQGPLTKADTEALEASVQAQTNEAVASGLTAGFQEAFTAVLENGFSRGAVRGVSRGAGEAGGAAIGGYFGREIGAKIGGEIGKAAGDAVGKWLEGLGKDSEGTKGRKQLDKYFAELFDANRLTAIIDGQLTQIKDLQFLGNQEGGGIFAGLSEQAQAEFEGVGRAFEEMFGIAGDLGVNFGQVLANNLGGDLNNLQLLIEATGKSFDELSEKMIQAFLTGDESVLKLAQDLQALHDVMTPGIPGAIGAIDKAWEHFAAAGPKGGRALLDSIQDIAIEAKELHVKTFPQLAAMLVNVFHEDAKQVEIFFQAVKNAGINSIEELANATQKQLVAVAANVEQFKETGVVGAFTGGTLGDTTTHTTSASRSYGSSSGGTKTKSPDKFEDITLRIIPKLATAAVRGVDDAIAELIKLDNTFKGQLSKDLFKDFKLSMNEAQVAAVQLGYSLQDMQNIALQSFKAGKTSASEAAKAIREAGQGIPDLVGGVAEAVKNLQKYGTKGGAFSIDALKDLGAEAAEAGIKELDKDRREQLIKSRADQLLIGREITKELLDLANKTAAEQIDKENNPFELLRKKLLKDGIDGATTSKLFEQFQKFGIDTIQEIQNVSDSVATQILGGLQDTGFAFQETSSQVTQLLDQLDKIPDVKEVNIKVNVSSGKVDKETARLLREAGIDPKKLIAIVTRDKTDGGTFSNTNPKLAPGKK